MLILGPSGAGKEELSRLVHREGARRKGPFVALNAGGLPRELIESELFGHERGAFTGAVGQRTRSRSSRPAAARCSWTRSASYRIDLQARLLRVLESWQIRRVGGESAIDLDVRLVCATHRDLTKMVQEGTFRQDLFYRLARLVLRVTPLSERRDDVLPLAEHFLRGLAPEVGSRTLSRQASERLLAYAWPGNARELRNVLCVAAALSPAAVLEGSDIDQAIGRLAGPVAAAIDPETIEQAVRRCGGNLSAAGRLLGIPRSTLRDRLKRRDLERSGETALPEQAEEQPVEARSWARERRFEPDELADTAE